MRLGSHGVRRIDSPKPATANGRRHFRVRFEPFQGLAAPFPSRSAAQSPLYAPDPPSISRPLRLVHGEAQTHRKREPSLARRSERFG
jgi:hypothetical protein